MGEPFSAEGAAKNRRVDLFLSSGSFEVPSRRRRSEIPHHPDEPPFLDLYDGDGKLRPDTDDDDGSADVSAPVEEMVTVVAPDGTEHRLTRQMVMMMHMMQMQGAESDEDLSEGEQVDDDEENLEGAELEEAD